MVTRRIIYLVIVFYSGDSNRKFIFLAMVSNATDDIYLDVVVQI